jgi:hypothetical protein
MGLMLLTGVNRSVVLAPTLALVVLITIVYGGCLTITDGTDGTVARNGVARWHR